MHASRRIKTAPRLGVRRQVGDCRQLAAQLGWTVAEEYIDNDVSAYSGKRRPGYERMMADLADGIRDAVIVYHADRLTRRPIELEQFLEPSRRPVCAMSAFVAGAPVDVGNGDGLLVLRCCRPLLRTSQQRRVEGYDESQTRSLSPDGPTADRTGPSVTTTTGSPYGRRSEDHPHTRRTVPRR